LFNFQLGYRGFLSNLFTSLNGKSSLWEFFNQRAQLIREPNEVRILRLVRDSGEISRVEIAKLCNLNKAYVSELVTRLIHGGFLKESGKAEGTDGVGRKRVLLKFVPLAGLVAGVDIGMTHSTVIITDLNATVLREKTFSYSLEASVHEVVSQVAHTIKEELADGNHSLSKLVGIGVGVQGLVDYRTNTVIVSHNKKSWEGESLSTELEDHFKIPVYVENDVKAMTLGEYLLGSAKGVKNLIYLFIGDGLGAGIMINGHLHRGFTSSAGEIGYAELEPAEYYKEQFPLLYNGQRIFGEILTDANIMASYARNTGQRNGKEISVATIAANEEKGDKVAHSVFEDCASLLSVLSINLINTINPELIVIGGKFAHCFPKVANLVGEKIHRDLLSVPSEAVQIKVATHGEDAVALGATSLVLYEMFEPLHTFSLGVTKGHSLKVSAPAARTRKSLPSIL
jgi:predicted NBD/HSP70 family sugar kinase